MSSLSVSRTRLLAPVWAKISVIMLRSSPSAFARPRPSARAAVLMFMTMFTSAFTWAALPISPVWERLMLMSSRMGLSLRKVSLSPPMMRKSEPSRAWLILEAMAPSREAAPSALAAVSISFWTWSETVAQFMKVVPADAWRRLSLFSRKMFLMAASLLTTVKTTSARDVSSARLVQCFASSSSASLAAVVVSMSLTAVI